MYEDLTGYSEGIFEVTAGILLDKIRHKTFDSLKWSLYSMLSDE